MRFFPLLLALMVMVACNSVHAQQVDYGRKLPASLKAESQSSVVLPTGYFNVRLKSTALSATDWLKNHQTTLGFSPEMVLRPEREEKALDGRSYLRLRQYREETPVLGADVIAQTTKNGGLQQLSGFLAPNELFPAPAHSASSVTTHAAPTLPDDELELIAKEFLLTKYPHVRQWNVLDHGDTWTATDPWRPSPISPYRKCRTLEIQEPAGSQAEMVYVDLLTGKVIFNHPLHCSLQRQLHYANTSRANIVWREGDAFPGLLNNDDQEMIKATEEVYSLYYRTFGRNGHDGQGSNMRAVNHANISGCPNARAHNYTIYACSGVVGDDIVGHEWTHNYTTSMNDLIFSYESGALQESLADIFGEAVDLLNDRGIDNNDQQPRTGCFSDNYRWSIAEDATAIDTILRDLWAPECKTDPEKRYSNLFVCNTPNGADIHSHSTVVSRTFALLVDGDTTLTPAVHGIGLTKALHIFYHANANYVTRVTDFSAFAAMLRQSAIDLQGINLPALTLVNTLPPLSNDSITDANLNSLDAAIAATQLDQPSQCPGAPTLSPDTPEVCADDTDVFITVFSETWEAETAGWTISQQPVHPEDWEEKPWELTTMSLPDSRPGRAMFAPNTHTGNCLFDIESGVVNLTSPQITLPAEHSGFQLRFSHYYSIEPGTDGGVLNYRLAGSEEFTPVPAEAFLFNGYDRALDPPVLNDNPVAGREAFTGANELSNTGSWGESIVDLSLAGLQPGDRFQLQWTLGHDGCDGWLGWYLDDIVIGFCGELALPVTYLSFTASATKDKVDLLWETTEEENNLGFYVERAHQGSFREIGFVAAHPTGNYTFRDEDVVAGNTYVYRLRQSDADGQENYSSIVRVTLSADRQLRVFPNPAVGAFTIRGAGETATIFDVSGRLVLRTPLSDGRGQVVDLARGVYVVRVGEEVQRIVIR